MDLNLMDAKVPRSDHFGSYIRKVNPNISFQNVFTFICCCSIAATSITALTISAIVCIDTRSTAISTVITAIHVVVDIIAVAITNPVVIFTP